MGNIMKINSALGNLAEWYEIALPILSHPEYQKRKLFRHHGDISVFDHCINVSKKSYYLAKRFNMDYKSATIAGLLHDFYETPWQDIKIDQPILKMHAFTHAENALINSQKYFKELLNPVIEDSILRHMYPLNKIKPKYKEGYLLTLVDKYVSLEIFKEPEVIIKTFGFMRSR